VKTAVMIYGFTKRL